MAQADKFRKGTQLIKQDAERKKSGRKFTPNIYWKAGDVQTIMWLTAADEIPKVRLHKMVRVPDDSRDSGVRYETLLCKKDPSMIDESGGACELCDHVGHEAQEQYVALAVQLEQVKTGKQVTALKPIVDVVKRDDGDQEYVRWGLVIQSAKNFFAYYGAFAESQGDIREVGWEIHREGGSTDTKYHPYIVMNGRSAVDVPDLSQFEDKIPALFDLLDEMGSDEKYASVAGLEPGSQPSFGGKSNSNGKQETAATPEPDTSAEDSSEFERIKAGLTDY